MRRTLALASLLLLTAQAPPPPLAPAAPLTPEISTIVVPIRTSLAPLLPQIEAQVPKRFAKLDAFETDRQGRFGVKYEVVRDPIVVNVQGSGLHAMTTAHYSLEGCTNTPSIHGGTHMWPCVSCGFGEPKRDAWISIDSRLSWDASWRIRSQTHAHPVEFTRRCSLTILGIDITDWKIAPLVNEQLREVAKTIDRNVPRAADLRPTAQQIWTSLQQPTEISRGVWLALDPEDVALGPIVGSGLDVQSTLVLRARTRVVAGPRPAGSSRPLPALRVEAPPPGAMRIPVDVAAAYDEASRRMSEQLGGKSFDTGGTRLTIRSVTLRPAADGRLGIDADVDYRGGFMRSFTGLVQLEGTPQFDPATATVALHGVEFALDPSRHNPFLRIADRLAHDTLRARLEESARWSLREAIDNVRQEIERGINRPLRPGVDLHGRVTSLMPLEMIVRPEALTLRLVATGNAEIVVSKW